jgi:outer membrane protein assembly factor BamB
MDRLEPPKFRATQANGDVLIAKTGNSVRAMRLSDGKDAWVIEPQRATFSHMLTDRAVVIFEHGRSVRIFDLETGKNRLEVSVPPFTDNLGLGALGAVALASGMVHENTLYFQSKALELYAVALDGGELWHTPLKRRIQSLREDRGRVYAGMNTGELIILDAGSGAIAANQKIAPKDLVLDYADADIVIASGEKAVYGLDPATGAKRWEYSATFSPKEVMYFKGVVTAKTSATQLSALDAETGALLWQYAGKRAPGFIFTKDSFFIIEENGIKEYAIDKSDVQAVTNREILTELASALVSKGDLSRAEAFVSRVASEIDADYAPMRGVRARLEKARGNRRTAARELAAYAALIGPDSTAGEQAIAELKQSYGLLWFQRFDTPLAGPPIPAGNKLISVGRSRADRNQIVALNPPDGTTIWRQIPERFSDAVVDASTGRAWYLSSAGEDPTAVVLYGVAIDSGERKQLARWNRPAAVSLDAIAYAGERLFTVTVSPDLAARKLTVAIDCFTAAGEKLWNRTHETIANLIEMQLPLGVFAPQDDYLMYSLGQDVWIVAASDGAVVREHHENAVIMPRVLRSAQAGGDPGTVYFLTAEHEIIGYNITSGSVSFRAALPENTRTFLLRDRVLYATNGVSVFAFAVGSSVKWRLNAQRDQRFLSLHESGAALWALRDDATLLQIDGSSGKILVEQALPWLPSGLHIAGNTVYAFTADRAGYALQLISGK